MGSCGQLDSECKMLQKIWSHQPIDDKWQDAVANSRIAAVNFSCIHPGLFILGRPQMTKRSMVANFFGPPSGDPQLWSRFKSESPIVCILGVGCQIFSSGGCWLLEHAETTRWSPLLMWIYRYLYTAFLYQHHLRKGYTTIVHRQKVTKKTEVSSHNIPHIISPISNSQSSLLQRPGREEGNLTDGLTHQQAKDTHHQYLGSAQKNNYLEVSITGGPPKWLVYKGKIPTILQLFQKFPQKKVGAQKLNTFSLQKLGAKWLPCGVSTNPRPWNDHLHRGKEVSNYWRKDCWGLDNLDPLGQADLEMPKKTYSKRPNLAISRSIISAQSAKLPKNTDSLQHVFTLVDQQTSPCFVVRFQPPFFRRVTTKQSRPIPAALSCSARAAVLIAYIVRSYVNVLFKRALKNNYI